MRSELRIASCDVLQGDKLVVSLSDTRVYIIHLEQILQLKAEPPEPADIPKA